MLGVGRRRKFIFSVSDKLPSNTGTSFLTRRVLFLLFHSWRWCFASRWRRNIPDGHNFGKPGGIIPIDRTIFFSWGTLRPPRNVLRCILIDIIQGRFCRWTLPTSIGQEIQHKSVEVVVPRVSECVLEIRVDVNLHDFEAFRCPHDKMTDTLLPHVELGLYLKKFTRKKKWGGLRH